MENQKVIEALRNKLPGAVAEVSSPLGDDTILISKDSLRDVIDFLYGKPYEFTMLLDLTCVDYLGAKPRFQMVYHVFSLSNRMRLRVKAAVEESDLKIDSLTKVWRNANWLEREVYDMFGVRFEGHPDLRRLFMYDGFEGHPLRKDYPLRKRQPCIPMRRTDDD
jgi:NADH-quinone oxidoreductase subunit C